LSQYSQLGLSSSIGVSFLTERALARWSAASTVVAIVQRGASSG
jgi:hypothetical protein